MPFNFPDGGTYDAVVTGPADGDPRTASGFLRTALQSLTNRVSYLKNLVGAASGLATLDGSSRVVQLPKNATVAIGNATYTATGLVSTTSTSYADLGGSSPAVVIASGLAVGDKVRIRGTSWVAATGGTATGLRLVVLDGASTIAIPELTFGGITVAGLYLSWSTIYTVVNGPNVTVKWQGNATGATNVGIGTNGTNYPSMLEVDVIRP